MDLPKSTKHLIQLSKQLHIEINRTQPSASSPTIVFLHGIASSSASWQPLTERLNKTHKLVHVDLLGFGKSPKPWRADYSVSTHAKAVWLALDEAGISEDIILIGHSMGGIIATHMATLRKKRVHELHMAALPIYHGHELQTKDLSRLDTLITKLYFKAYGYLREDALFTSFVGASLTKLLYNRIGFTLGPRSFISFRRSLKNCVEFQHTRSELQALRIPIHLYAGLYDVLAPLRYIKRLKNETKRSTLKVLAAGHTFNDAYAASMAENLTNAQPTAGQT